MRACAQCRHRRIACVELTSDGCRTCTKRRVQCTGPTVHQKHTRVAKGAKMAEIRQTFGSIEPKLEVATINSPTSLLVMTELAAALHYHLVQAARTAARNTTPGTRLDPLAYQLAPTTFRREEVEILFSDCPLLAKRRANPLLLSSPQAAPSDDRLISNAVQRRAPIFSEHADTAELVHACFSAFGSRWSSHSAIVGSSSTASSSQQGAEREGPCHALIDRAIAVAEGQGLLSSKKPTIKQARAAAFLLQTAHVVAPNHHALPQLVRDVQRIRLAAYSNKENLTREVQWSWNTPVPDTAILDAQFALRSHSSCTLSDDDISSTSAWSPSVALKSAKYLQSLIPKAWNSREMDPESLYLHLCAVNLYLLRSLVLLRQDCQQQPPIFIYSSFTHLAEIFDITITPFKVKRKQIAASTALLESGWLDMLNGQSRCSLEYVSHVCSSIQAIARANEAWGQSGFCAELSDRFARILLRAVKHLIESSALQELDDVARVMDVAPLVADLAPDFDWLSLVVSAASPSSSFADLGLTIGHITRLQSALERIGQLYGIVSQQSEKLSEGLVSLLDVSRGPHLPGFIEEVQDDQRDTFAKLMVEVTLEDLET